MSLDINPTHVATAMLSNVPDKTYSVNLVSLPSFKSPNLKKD